MPVQAVLISSLVTNHYEPEGKMLILHWHILWLIEMVYLIRSKPFGLFIYLKVAHKVITVFWRATYLPYAACQ